MTIHTLCLNILILIVLICPGTTVQAFFWHNEKKELLNILSYILLFCMIITVFPFKYTFILELRLYYCLIPVLALLFIAGELLLNGIFSKKKISNLDYVMVNKKIEYVYVLIIPIFEEFIYRYAWNEILSQLIEKSSIIILFSATAYASNHLFLGKRVFFSKIVTGLFYGGIYLYTGDLVFVIFIHILANIYFTIFSRRVENR